MSSARYSELECSVARTLEHIGERWTILIVRDAFFGIRRFDEFQASLGIARNILTTRLTALVDNGVMRKERYQDHPPRFEYRLTEKGRDLIPVLTALLAWGDRWDADDGDPIALIHTTCGNVMHTRSVCEHCREDVDAFNLSIDPVPAIVLERMSAAREG